MTRPKRRKNATSSAQSEESLGLEDEIIVRLKKLESKIEATANTSTSKLIEELEKLQGYIHDLHVENETIKKELNNMKEERTILVEEARQLRVVCNILQGQNNDLEQYTRRNNIRIFGVRETARFEKSEDTTREVEKIIRKLNILNLNATCIDVAHRIGQQRPASDRAILVRLTSHKAQSKILSARRTLKGTGIVITEDLTRANSARYHRIREMPRVYQAWTKFGDTYVKLDGKEGRVVKINKQSSLQEVNKYLEEAAEQHGPSVPTTAHKPLAATYTRGVRKPLRTEMCSDTTTTDNNKISTGPRQSDGTSTTMAAAATQEIATVIKTPEPAPSAHQTSNQDSYRQPPTSTPHQRTEDQPPPSMDVTPVQHRLMTLAQRSHASEGDDM